MRKYPGYHGFMTRFANGHFCTSLLLRRYLRRTYDATVSGLARQNTQKLATDIPAVMTSKIGTRAFISRDLSLFACRSSLTRFMVSRACKPVKFPASKSTSAVMPLTKHLREGDAEYKLLGMPDCVTLLTKHGSVGCLLVLIALTISQPIVSDRQQRAARRESHVRFVSPDGMFAFEYPNSLIKCERDPKQSDWWIPARSCEAVIPPCAYASLTKDATVVCIAYPAETLIGTNFEAAAFSVNKLDEATAEECLQVTEPHPATSHKEKVNGVTLHKSPSFVLQGQDRIHTTRPSGGDECRRESDNSKHRAGAGQSRDIVRRHAEKEATQHMPGR